MKKILSLITICLLTLTINAQWTQKGADLDGDGDMEVLSASFNDSKIAWYENLSLIDNLNEVFDLPISLFPNPMTESAVLDLGELTGEFTVEIYDVKGQLIRSEQLSTNNGQLIVKRAGLSTGSYILRLSNTESSHQIAFTVD